MRNSPQGRCQKTCASFLACPASGCVHKRVTLPLDRFDRSRTWQLMRLSVVRWRGRWAFDSPTVSQPASSQRPAMWKKLMCIPRRAWTVEGVRMRVKVLWVVRHAFALSRHPRLIQILLFGGSESIHPPADGLHLCLHTCLFLILCVRPKTFAVFFAC